MWRAFETSKTNNFSKLINYFGEKLVLLTLAWRLHCREWWVSFAPGRCTFAKFWRSPQCCPSLQERIVTLLWSVWCPLYVGRYWSVALLNRHADELVKFVVKSENSLVSICLLNFNIPIFANRAQSGKGWDFSKRVAVSIHLRCWIRASVSFVV